jgi:hypothetical protein
VIVFVVVTVLHKWGWAHQASKHLHKPNL